MDNTENQAEVEEEVKDETENLEDTATEALNNEAEESALLDNEEPMDDAVQEPNESTLLEENDTQGDKAEKDEVAKESEEAEVNDAAGDDAVVEDSMDDGAGIGKEEEEEEEEEEEDEGITLSDNEMPQVNVAILAKRKWQVKIYPLKPDDFMNGQISRVFSNARESLLYIINSGKANGGKGEMYVSSGMQASKVVHNLMKLDFKSQNINIEIIRKNDEGVIEEKAFMRFDTKLVRILCVPLFRSRRLGSRRERIIGSVFVKNLPNGTSKDMLRVMFPFAPEINYNPDKFHDGTARLVLSTRSAVVPCLKGFTKVELGGALLELRPLQKKGGKDDDKSQESEDAESTKKESKGEAEDLSEGESKPSDSKKDEKGSPRPSSERAARGSSKTGSAKKSPATSKSTDGKKPEKKDRESESGTPRAANKSPRDQGANRNRRNSRDNRRDIGAHSSANRVRGRNFVQRGDRNRFRAGGSGFGNRPRPDDRRMRMPGAGPGDTGINAGAAKEMFMLQSQLSVAIKNQLSMLNQTQFALEQAKREAATISFSRNAGQGSSTGLMNRRASNTEQNRGGQMKSDNRRQQNKRGRPRDNRRAEGQRLGGRGGGGGDYGYKRNAEMAGLQAEYGSTGLGKRRSAGLGGHSESHSWADDRGAAAFHHPHPAAFGYEAELDEREAEFRALHAGLSPRSLTYSQSNYGYRY